MIRYSYTKYTSLPAPFVHVVVRCPQTGTTSPEAAAEIDSAADRTVVPGKLIDDLKLEPLGLTVVAGLGGQLHRLQAYRVDVAIRSMASVRVEVVRNDDEPFVLLGRDVLNRFRVLLDGPGQAVEVS